MWLIGFRLFACLPSSFPRPPVCHYITPCYFPVKRVSQLLLLRCVRVAAPEWEKCVPRLQRKPRQQSLRSVVCVILRLQFNAFAHSQSENRRKPFFIECQSVVVAKSCCDGTAPYMLFRWLLTNDGNFTCTNIQSRKTKPQRVWIGPIPQRIMRPPNTYNPILCFIPFEFE